MDGSSLPVWAQGASIIAISLVTAIVGVFKYFKTEQKETIKEVGNSTISASFIDSKVLREIAEAIRDHQEASERSSKKGQRLSQDLKEAVNELNETIIIQTDATLNLVKFVNREVNKNQSRSTV